MNTYTCAGHIQNRSFIKIQVVQNVPEKVAADQRHIIKTSATISYDEMCENDITVEEMRKMGVDLRLFMFTFGERPHLQNLSFKESSIETIKIVAKILQSAVFNQTFTQVTWFGIGLTMVDLVQLKPDINTLLAYKVTYKELLNYGAYEGADGFWGIAFPWTPSDWARLGYSDESRRDYISTNTLSQATVKKINSFGPSCSRLVI
jgi:hypothetical protein